MPSKNPNPRIAVYLDPNVYATIKRLSQLNGEPMSRIVGDLVEAVAEPLMRTVAFLEAAADAPKQIKDGLRGTMEQMERELYGVAGYTMGQMDWLINEIGKGEGGERGGESPTRAPSAPSRRSAAAKSNPPNVIRGSGQSKSLKDKETGVSGKRAKKGGKNG